MQVSCGVDCHMPDLMAVPVDVEEARRKTLRDLGDVHKGAGEVHGTAGSQPAEASHVEKLVLPEQVWGGGKRGERGGCELMAGKEKPPRVRSRQQPTRWGNGVELREEEGKGGSGKR